MPRAIVEIRMSCRLERVGAVTLRRRDDRRDDRGPPENWGVSGFTNSPFSKLNKDDKK